LEDTDEPRGDRLRRSLCLLREVGMKVLVIGAGVIGSFNAARLARARVEVKLLARR
jgi:hypothetical protein